MKKGRNTPQTTTPAAPVLGLRERNKLNKAQLIRNASRQLFFEKGYEATTLREVAKLADVGFGTVSAYATDKAGLLAMLFVEDLDHLPALFDESHNDDAVIDQLVEAFAHLYEFWALRAELSRIVLPQMEFYNSNRFTEEILRRREQLRKNLALWLKTCQKNKRIKSKIDTDQAAALLFAVYTSALREWIVKDPLDIQQGLARLHYLLAIPMAAIAV